MAHIEVFGCSDDLIEVDGDIRDEFGRYAIGKWSFVVFDEGTVLRVGYAVDGTGNWRVERIREGEAQFNRVPAEMRQVEDPDEYSDVGVLDGDVRGLKFYASKASAMRMAGRVANTKRPTIR